MRRSKVLNPRLDQRRRNPEEGLHFAVVHYLRIAKPDAIWFHPANGGYRLKGQAARLFGMGVRAGVPDLVFVSGEGAYFIELKAPGGRLSPEQRRFEAECAARDIPFRVCSSVDEVHQALRWWALVSESVSVGERLPYREAQ